jgi:hypothetical protein
MCVTLLVAVGGGAPLSAFADSCPDKIVVGKRGDGTDEYGYFNNARIASAAIPTGPGAKYVCTYESHYGMRDESHQLNANELIQSVAAAWQKDGGAYACQSQASQDCSFVIQKN